MPPLQHQLSWSVSRAGSFRRCERQYYHDYYLSWLGWQSNSDAVRQQAYRLKKMSRTPMLAGSIVHEAIQDWLQAKQSGQLILPETVTASAVSRLRAAFGESATAKADGRWEYARKGDTRLAEHYYGEAISVPGADTEAYVARYEAVVETCLNNFFALPDLEPVRAADPQDYLAIESMGTFQVAGTPVYAVPDFAFARQDEPDATPEVWIFDWKTGKQRALDSHQLAVYVLYAMSRWGVIPEDVVCVLAYLTDGSFDVHRFTIEEIESVAQRIVTSIETMRERHFDAGLGLGDASLFPKRPEDEEGLRACSYCNYREI